MIQLRIVESIHGTWHYHLTDQPIDGSSEKALCGARAMRSSAPLDSWGYKPDHMPTSYCAECASLGGIATNMQGHMIMDTCRHTNAGSIQNESDNRLSIECGYWTEAKGAEE